MPAGGVQQRGDETGYLQGRGARPRSPRSGCACGSSTTTRRHRRRARRARRHRWPSGRRAAWRCRRRPCRRRPRRRRGGRSACAPSTRGRRRRRGPAARQLQRRSRHRVARTTTRRPPARRAAPGARPSPCAARRSIRPSPRRQRPVTLANVVGRANWPSVRPIIGAVPSAADSASHEGAAPPRGGRRSTSRRGWRRSSPRYRGCPGSSTRDGRTGRRRRPTRARSCSTMPITGTPLRSVASPRASRSSWSIRHAAAIAAAASARDHAGRSLGGSEGRFDVELRLSQAAADVASATAPWATRWSNGPASDRQEDRLFTVALQSDVEAVLP